MNDDHCGWNPAGGGVCSQYCSEFTEDEPCSQNADCAWNPDATKNVNGFQKALGECHSVCTGLGSKECADKDGCVKDTVSMQCISSRLRDTCSENSEKCESTTGCKLQNSVCELTSDTESKTCYHYIAPHRHNRLTPTVLDGMCSFQVKDVDRTDVSLESINCSDL
jgi:hypothetical protein